MAKGFVRYEQQLTGLKIPDVEFAAEKQAARNYSKISSDLDRMSQFFMSQAGEMAKIEGAEYGAANAPTEQQIKDAYKEGEPLDLVGDSYSVYGRSARNAALNAATDEIEFLAKKKMMEYLVSAEKQDLPYETVIDELETISAGFSATLDAESPGNAKKLRAALGIYGYTKGQSYASDQLGRIRIQKQAAFAASFQLSLEGIRDVIANSTSKEVQLTEAEAAQAGKSSITYSAGKVADSTLDYQLNEILRKAVGLNYSKTQIEALVKDWNNEIKRASNALVVEEVLGHQSPKSFLTSLEGAAREFNTRGSSTKYRDQLPAKVRNALALAKPEDRQGMVDLARQSWLTTLQDKEKEISFNNTIREEDTRVVENDFNTAILARDVPAMTVAATKMRELDPKRAGEMLESISLVGEMKFAFKSEPTVFFKYERDLLMPNPVMTLADLRKDLTDKKLTFDDFKKFSEKYMNLYDESYKDALDIVRATVGIPQNAYADNSLMKSVAGKIYTTIENQLLRAKRADTTGTFDPMAWVDQNLSSFYVQATQDVTGPIKLQAGNTTRDITLRLISKARSEGRMEDVNRLEQFISDVDAILAREPDLILPGWN